MEVTRTIGINGLSTSLRSPEINAAQREKNERNKIVSINKEERMEAGFPFLPISIAEPVKTKFKAATGDIRRPFSLSAKKRVSMAKWCQWAYAVNLVMPQVISSKGMQYWL
ncbi:hypothetical protein BUE76_22110 [Cnuella takakiae]|nr:hypothetical protein BUE76_22110 [Cnuella takakiae]